MTRHLLKDENQVWPADKTPVPGVDQEWEHFEPVFDRNGDAVDVTGGDAQFRYETLDGNVPLDINGDVSAGLDHEIRFYISDQDMPSTPSEGIAEILIDIDGNGQWDRRDRYVFWIEEGIT